MFFFVTGVIGILISGFCLGAWTDRGRPRDNSWVEVDSQRAIKTKIGLISGAIGLVLFVLAVIPTN